VRPESPRSQPVSRYHRVPQAPPTDAPAAPDWRVLRSLWPYLREFPGRIAVAMACLVAAKLAGTALPMVLKYIVDALDRPQDALVAVPLALLLGYGGLRLANVLFAELRDVVFGRVGERAMRRAALAVFRHLHSLDVDFHLSRRTGGLSRDIERGISGINFLLRFMLFNILPTLLEIALVAGILLFNYGASFAVVTTLAVLVYMGFSVVTTEWRTRFVREANRLDSEANTRAIDSLLNYETVKLFGNEQFEAAAYDRQLAQWERAQQQNRLSLAALNSGQALIVGASLTWMMVMAAQGVADGTMTLGDFVAINAYLIQLFIPLNFLGFVYREIRRALTDMQRMFGLLEVAPRVVDGSRELDLGGQAPTIAFQDVHFGYGPDRSILQGLDLQIPAGRKLAVVGASGAGKSTVARLLFRLYDAGAGRVLVGDHDVRELSQHSLRAHIGVVPQDTVLFDESIEYNIAYGRPGATRDEIEAAARLAHLDGFIGRLPQGYATRVGERGLKLSGGEKQRVAIARALLKNPPVMIFDEATSSLDSASEKAILDALREVARSRTTLVIAHRLSTVVDADEIVVLDHGRIVERGRHAALIAADGPYARLWRMQLREHGESLA
jgi:ABC-type transport system involved in Fe-S cluster assembly fused permease/ATPase subunit